MKWEVTAEVYIHPRAANSPASKTSQEGGIESRHRRRCPRFALHHDARPFKRHV